MAAQLAPLEVIERTRRGEPVDGASVEAFVRSWVDRTCDDALMAAWCMAGVLRGLEPEAVDGLMRALIASGDRLDLASLGATGDIHSTGGVGDTVPIIAAPLAAALGVRVATMADRARSYGGGTMDKLETIPGFEVEMALGRFVRQVRDTGIAVIAQTPRLAPADGRLSTLRDATATVPGAGLIAASIMSRALAGGAGAVSLQITCGEGAFLGADEAEGAAALMADLAGPWGRPVRWTVCAMDQPPGRCVGNALEVGEAAEVLRGGGAADERELAIRVAGDLAEAAGVVEHGTGREAAAAALRDGRALASAELWVEAQEGDPRVWTEPNAIPTAPARIDLPAPHAGWVSRVRAGGIGEVARWLGVGRLHPDQSLDPVVGIELLAKVGDRVAEGDPMAVIHARDESTGQRARDMVASSFTVGQEAVEAPRLILGEGRRDP